MRIFQAFVIAILAFGVMTAFIMKGAPVDVIIAAGGITAVIGCYICGGIPRERLSSTRSMMTNLLFALVGVIVIVAFFLGGGTVQAQQSRLRIEGILSLHSYGVRGNELTAICDTGNGTMIYVSTAAASDGGRAIAILPNGCK